MICQCCVHNLSPLPPINKKTFMLVKNWQVLEATPCLPQEATACIGNVVINLRNASSTVAWNTGYKSSQTWPCFINIGITINWCLKHNTLSKTMKYLTHANSLRHRTTLYCKLFNVFCAPHCAKRDVKTWIDTPSLLQSLPPQPRQIKGLPDKASAKAG